MARATVTMTHVIIVTQKEIGKALLKAAKNIFHKLPLPITCVAINYRAKPEVLIEKFCRLTNDFDEADVLILTDLYGSTPSNIANGLARHCKKPSRVISGLNLPMLVKILNYAELPLDELAKKAVQGGKEGILDSINKE